MLLKTTALVLRVVDFSETSQIIHALSPDQGLVAAIAKGARRPGKRALGPFDRLALCDLLYYEKTGDALHLVKDAETLDTYAGVRRSMPSWYAALCVAELCAIAARPKDEAIQLFASATRALENLATPCIDWRVALVDFFARYLAAIGHAPDLTRCPATDLELARLPAVELVIGEGHAYHPQNVPAGVASTRLDATSLAVLVRFLRGVKNPLQRVNLPASILRPLAGLLTALIVHALERQPVTFKHLHW